MLGPADTCRCAVNWLLDPTSLYLIYDHSCADRRAVPERGCADYRTWPDGIVRDLPVSACAPPHSQIFSRPV